MKLLIKIRVWWYARKLARELIGVSDAASKWLKAVEQIQHKAGE